MVLLAFGFIILFLTACSSLWHSLVHTAGCGHMLLQRLMVMVL